MVKILMHGCNGKMGRMITEIVKNEEDAVIAAGVDKFTGISNDYPVFEESQKKKCLLQESKVEFDKAIETWNKIEQIKKLQEEITREIEQTRYVLSNLK